VRLLPVDDDAARVDRGQAREARRHRKLMLNTIQRATIAQMARPDDEDTVGSQVLALSLVDPSGRSSRRLREGQRDARQVFDHHGRGLGHSIDSGAQA
jgi:hypothetical protein